MKQTSASQLVGQFSSVQFSFISAPPHEQNNKMLKSLCVVKDGVRKRKKQQNELTLCLANVPTCADKKNCSANQ